MPKRSTLDYLAKAKENLPIIPRIHLEIHCIAKGFVSWCIFTGLGESRLSSVTTIGLAPSCALAATPISLFSRGQ